jgi:hypothetical protein
VHYEIALVRYNADGTLDSSFGGGTAVTNLRNSSARAEQSLPDGRGFVTSNCERTSDDQSLPSIFVSYSRKDTRFIDRLEKP